MKWNIVLFPIITAWEPKTSFMKFRDENGNGLELSKHPIRSSTSINFSSSDNILPVKLLRAILIDLCLVRIKLAQFRAILQLRKMEKVFLVCYKQTIN